MSPKNLLGGLALDSTLGELLTAIVAAQEVNTERPLMVASPDGGMPINVRGSVEAVQPGQGRAVGTAIDKTSTSASAWEQVLPPNASRVGLSVLNIDTSGSGVFLSLTDTAPTPDATARPVMIHLAPGDYWECPARYVGGVAIIWRTASVAGYLRITEYF